MRKLADTWIGLLRRFIVLGAAQISDVVATLVLSGTVAAILVVAGMLARSLRSSVVA
jgi:hypothetical protein